MTDDCPICKGTGKLDLGELTIAQYLEFKQDAAFKIFLSANSFLDTKIEMPRRKGRYERHLGHRAVDDLFH